jgi:antitoxin (DNA-binding transcriptional repressor) of toxin-antitoxin stability system
MKTIEMAEATESLSEYARKTRHETLVVMRKGKPVAALTPIGSRTDLENLAVNSDPEFRALIERSRGLYPPGRGLTTAEVRRRLAASRRPSRRSANRAR